MTATLANACLIYGNLCDYDVVSMELKGYQTAAFGSGARVHELNIGSCQIEAIRVHDLRPCRYEISHELFVGIILGIDFGIGPEDRV